MKKQSLLLFILVLFAACNQENKTSPEQLIRKHYEGFNQGDLNKILSTVSDSILMKEGDFVLANSKESLKIYFQWDSVFQPSYRLDSIVEKDGQYVCTLTKNCKRINYMHKSPTQFQQLVTISGDKITTIEAGDYIVFDFEKWQANREALQAWVNIQFPGLKNFMFIPGKEGAQNFLMLIELYEAYLLKSKEDSI